MPRKVVAATPVTTKESNPTDTAQQTAQLREEIVAGHSNYGTVEPSPEDVPGPSPFRFVARLHYVPLAMCTLALVLQPWYVPPGKAIGLWMACDVEASPSSLDSIYTCTDLSTTAEAMKSTLNITLPDSYVSTAAATRGCLLTYIVLTAVLTQITWSVLVDGAGQVYRLSFFVLQAFTIIIFGASVLIFGVNFEASQLVDAWAFLLTAAAVVVHLAVSFFVVRAVRRKAPVESNSLADDKRNHSNLGIRGTLRTWLSQEEKCLWRLLTAHITLFLFGRASTSDRFSYNMFVYVMLLWTLYQPGIEIRYVSMTTLFLSIIMDVTVASIFFQHVFDSGSSLNQMDMVFSLTNSALKCLTLILTFRGRHKSPAERVLPKHHVPSAQIPLFSPQPASNKSPVEPKKPWWSRKKKNESSLAQKVETHPPPQNKEPPKIKETENIEKEKYIDSKSEAKETVVGSTVETDNVSSVSQGQESSEISIVDKQTPLDAPKPLAATAIGNDDLFGGGAIDILDVDPAEKNTSGKLTAAQRKAERKARKAARLAAEEEERKKEQEALAAEAARLEVQRFFAEEKIREQEEAARRREREAVLLAEAQRKGDTGGSRIEAFTEKMPLGAGPPKRMSRSRSSERLGHRRTRSQSGGIDPASLLDNRNSVAENSNASVTTRTRSNSIGSGENGSKGIPRTSSMSSLSKPRRSSSFSKGGQMGSRTASQHDVRTESTKPTRTNSYGSLIPRTNSLRDLRHSSISVDLADEKGYPCPKCGKNFSDMIVAEMHTRKCDA